MWGKAITLTGPTRKAVAHIPGGKFSTRSKGFSLAIRSPMAVLPPWWRAMPIAATTRKMRNTEAWKTLVQAVPRMPPRVV